MLKAEEILEVIRTKLDHPSTIRELMQQMRLPREQRVTLRRRLATLVDSGGKRRASSSTGTSRLSWAPETTPSA